MKRLLAMLAVFLLSLQSALAFEQITGFVPTSENEFRADVGLNIEQAAVYTLSVDIPQNSKLVSRPTQSKFNCNLFTPLFPPFIFIFQ